MNQTNKAIATNSTGKAIRFVVIAVIAIICYFLATSFVQKDMNKMQQDMDKSIENMNRDIPINP